VGIWKETDLDCADVVYRNCEETTEEQVTLYFGIFDIPYDIPAGISILDIWRRKGMNSDLEAKANKYSLSAQLVLLLAGIIYRSFKDA
jgi:hypothetical protein